MAARLDEIAEGIATILGASPTPEPLKVDMWNQSPVNVAFFVRALAAACEHRAAPLALVRLDKGLGELLVRTLEEEPLEGPEVMVELVEGLGASIEVYRRLPK